MVSRQSLSSSPEFRSRPKAVLQLITKSLKNWLSIVRRLINEKIFKWISDSIIFTQFNNPNFFVDISPCGDIHLSPHGDISHATSNWRK
jgi:hypothetical protein